MGACVRASKLNETKQTTRALFCKLNGSFLLLAGSRSRYSSNCENRDLMRLTQYSVASSNASASRAPVPLRKEISKLGEVSKLSARSDSPVSRACEETVDGS